MFRTKDNNCCPRNDKSVKIGTPAMSRREYIERMIYPVSRARKTSIVNVVVNSKHELSLKSPNTYKLADKYFPNSIIESIDYIIEYDNDRFCWNMLCPLKGDQIVRTSLLISIKVSDDQFIITSEYSDDSAMTMKSEIANKGKFFDYIYGLKRKDFSRHEIGKVIENYLDRWLCGLVKLEKAPIPHILKNIVIGNNQ